MTAETSGVFQYTKALTQPQDLEQWLTKNTLLTPTTVAQLFTDFTPEFICLQGCAFAAGGCDSFASELSKSVTLTGVSFNGITINEHFSMQPILNALIENLSIQSVDLENCRLSEQDGLLIASSVIPWNKTIITWNFSGNPIGDTGARAIAAAFGQAMSSVHKISFRGCQITDLRPVIAPLLDLTSIIQLDFGGNVGLNESVKKLLEELDQLLQRNIHLLHSDGRIGKHVPLVSSIGAPPAAVVHAEPKLEPKRVLERRTSMSKRPEVGASSPERRRGTSMVKNDSFTANQLPPRRAASNVASAAPEKKHKPEAAPASSTTTHAPPPTSAAGPANHTANATSQPQSSETTTHEPPKTEVSAQEKSEKPADSKAPSEAPKHPNDRKANSELRRSSSAPAKRMASPGSTQHSHQRVRQEQIDEGLEKWREIQKNYNAYIRSNTPGAKPHVINRDPPKFVLGKRLDQIKEHPSSAFRTGYARCRERAPTPAEIRKLAPWNAKDNKEPIPVGAVHRVVIPAESRTKEPTVITFVNGGDLTYVSDDPRDIGYLARKAQAGQLKTKPTLFLSNTPREVRWGCNEGQAGYVHKKAQAPGPGYYTVESEWDKRARKLRESSRNMSATCRPMFGGTAAERSGVGVVKQNGVPGPGFYEIP